MAASGFCGFVQSSTLFRSLWSHSPGRNLNVRQSTSQTFSPISTELKKKLKTENFTEPVVGGAAGLCDICKMGMTDGENEPVRSLNWDSEDFELHFGNTLEQGAHIHL